MPRGTIWMELKTHFVARSLEWFNGYYLMMWGAYVILHPGMMTREETKHVFSGFLDLGLSQEGWGLSTFSCGIIRLGALWVNGRWGLTPLIRVATSFVSVFAWFWITVGLIRSGIPQTGTILYSGLMVADMFSAFRAASDAYEAEATRRLKAQMESSNVRSFASRS